MAKNSCQNFSKSISKSKTIPIFLIFFSIKECQSKVTFQNLVVPSVKTLGLSLSLPYLLSHGLAPALISSPSVLVTLQRRIYPLLLLITGLVFFFTVQARQFKKLLEHIKNDRLIEQTLDSDLSKLKNF